MTRSIKADMELLGEIPSCQVLTTELELSRPEKKAYNGLVTVIKRNLVLAECGGSRVDSLLYQKNRKYALEAINNARKSCCVAGQFHLELVRAHLDECILDMRRGHSLHEFSCQCNGSYFDVPSLKQKHVTTRTGECPLLEDLSRVVPERRVHAIENAFAGVGGSHGMRAVVNTHDGHIKCDACTRLSVFPFITPCGHMICLECVDANSQQVRVSACLLSVCFCVKCWTRLTRGRNVTSDGWQATTQCPVCQSLYSHGRFAHFQPSVENPKMEWNADWLDSVSTKVALLLTRLRGYGFFQKLPINEVWWSNVVARRVRHSTPQMLHVGGSSTAAAAAAARVRAGRDGRVGKCIIFSNFIEAIDSVANSLTEALYETGVFMRFTANLKGGTLERISALQMFRDDDTISILLLDGVGAVGLDLSFVSHIFLLDPIWDASLEDQVISRAHRLGAKQAITVEKLIARDTIEQMMESLARQKPDASPASHAVSSTTPAQPDAHGESSGEGSSRKPGVHKRERGDELKRQKESTKICTILTGLHTLTYDPDAEREREDLADFLAIETLQAPSTSAYVISHLLPPDSARAQDENTEENASLIVEMNGDVCGAQQAAAAQGKTAHTAQDVLPNANQPAAKRVRFLD